MQRRITGSFVSAVVALVFLFGGLAVAEDMKKKAVETAAEQPSAAGEMNDDMKKMMALAKPGPQHEQLAKYAGDFTAEVSMWMDPAQPPMKSTGKLHNEVFGGKYLMGNYEGTFMGAPFKGMSCTGYDNGKKKYFSAWIDDMGTGLMHSEGDADASGKKLTMTCETYCPQTNGMMKVTEVMNMVDDDTMKMEMSGPGPDGKVMKMMEITYKRVK